MLKFYLRLFLLMTVGYVLSGPLLLNRLIERHMEPRLEAYYRDTLRGQIYMLMHDLAPLDAAARARRVAELQPHFGIRLALVDRDRFAVSAEERAQLARGEFVTRRNNQEFLAPFPDPHDRQWLHLVLPPDLSLTTGQLSIAYTCLAILVGLVVLIWVRPLWRDLQSLKQAAQRMGAGDLRARAGISRLSSIRDIAQQFNQMGEQLYQLIHGQRELTNALSHELRTPIARLSFELSLLREEADPVARQALYDDMHGDLVELDEMASELLAYARLEHQQGPLKLEYIDPLSWLEGVLDQVALEAKSRQILCRVEACRVASAQIEPRFMARALVNLLRNAIRHADRRIDVRFETDGTRLRLSVADDGPGIPADQRERIFEPFTRLDQSRNRETGGFGLGLAIVRRVAQWHGGRVSAGAAASGGALFVIDWPAVAPTSDGQAR